MAVALTTTNPYYLAIVLLSILLVSILAPKTSAGLAGFRTLLALGTGLFAMSVAIAVINGNYGSHILFTVPGPDLPIVAWGAADRWAGVRRGARRGRHPGPGRALRVPGVRRLQRRGQPAPGAAERACRALPRGARRDGRAHAAAGDDRRRPPDPRDAGTSRRGHRSPQPAGARGAGGHRRAGTLDAARGGDGGTGLRLGAAAAPVPAHRRRALRAAAPAGGLALVLLRQPQTLRGGIGGRGICRAGVLVDRRCAAAQHHEPSQRPRLPHRRRSRGGFVGGRVICHRRRPTRVGGDLVQPVRGTAVAAVFACGCAAGAGLRVARGTARLRASRRAGGRPQPSVRNSASRSAQHDRDAAERQLPLPQRHRAGAHRRLAGHRRGRLCLVGRAVGRGEVHAVAAVQRARAAVPRRPHQRGDQLSRGSIR